MQPFLTEPSDRLNQKPAPPVRERIRIFVHYDIDELGLDPYEFRIYGHIARRRKCFASLDKIAATCCMSVRKVQYVLKVLEQADLISKEKREGRVNTFRLKKPSCWLGKLDRDKLKEIRMLVRAGDSQKTATGQAKSSRLNVETRLPEHDAGSADDSDGVPF